MVQEESDDERDFAAEDENEDEQEDNEVQDDGPPPLEAWPGVPRWIAEPYALPEGYRELFHELGYVFTNEGPLAGHWCRQRARDRFIRIEHEPTDRWELGRSLEDLTYIAGLNCVEAFALTAELIAGVRGFGLSVLINDIAAYSAALDAE